MRVGAVLLNATEVSAGAPVRGGGHRSGWQSPVPYLFGGLAAMLGLVAFALLLLACSYWKLSGYLNRGDGDDDDGGGVERPDDAKLEAVRVTCYEEKVVVIMAGDEKPTYLATPMSSRASSFGDSSKDDDDADDDEKKEKEKGEWK